MGKGQALEQIDSQTAVVVYPEDGTTASMIRAEPAHDATGEEVATSLTVEGTDVVTLTVKHKAPGLVYPVVGGPRFEVGYVVVRAVIPPEPGPGVDEGATDISEYWESAPEAATASDAGFANHEHEGHWEHKRFRWIQCEPIGEVGDVPPYFAPRPGGVCGNPFAGEEGDSGIAFSVGIRGDYYRVTGSIAKHLGSPTDHIECAKKYNKAHIDDQGIAKWEFFINPAQRCEWYGKTKDGGGAEVGRGKHLTPYGEWNWGVKGAGEDQWHINQMGLALYLWVTDTNHVGRHKTTCIDC
jgi:hypothetical protein